MSCEWMGFDVRDEVDEDVLDGAELYRLQRLAECPELADPVWVLVRGARRWRR